MSERQWLVPAEWKRIELAATHYQRMMTGTTYVKVAFSFAKADRLLRTAASNLNGLLTDSSGYPTNYFGYTRTEAAEYVTELHSILIQGLHQLDAERSAR